MTHTTVCPRSANSRSKATTCRAVHLLSDASIYWQSSPSVVRCGPSRPIIGRRVYLLWRMTHTTVCPRSASSRSEATTCIENERLSVYLTQCVYQLVLRSKLPNKTVILTTVFVIVNNKLTISWGVDFLILISKYILRDRFGQAGTYAGRCWGGRHPRVVVT